MEMTHQYLSSSSPLREVIVTVKTPAVLSSAMKLLLLNRFLGVFTTIVHSSYTFPLHQYFVWFMYSRLYWQRTVTDPPYVPVTSDGADRRLTESTVCFVSQRRQRTGAGKEKKKLSYIKQLFGPSYFTITNYRGF